LKELTPYFVSAADSGNFVACLYVVQGFLNKLKDTELLPKVTELIENTNFAKMYNYEIDVFSIGYDYGGGALLPYHYNNFASEARLTSYIAICKGDVPYKHWFCLDKTLTKYKHSKGIASWYGTLFEYFMPLIFLKTYRHTLMDETYSFASYVQQEFMQEIDKNLPWGISESGYHELDDALNYKYRAFGVPYLKFQNTISNRIVISPYSSLLTVSVDDKEVYENMQRFKQLKMYGEFGFFESYDEEDKAVVEAYYAHHQGMIFASLANYLKNNCIQEYFHTDKKIQSMELLLKEKAQIRPYIDLKITKYKRYQYSKERQENDIREYNSLGKVPELGILSNGFYNVSLNDRGIGVSRYKTININRYRKVTSENYGMFFYIRNMQTDEVWSNTYAPLDVKPDKYRVIFASDRIKYIREDNGIVTSTEIAVVKDSYAEIRKLTFENQTAKDVRLEVTSYGEIIMCRNEEDLSHRAFNGITIFSEIDHPTSSLIFTRKSRTNENTKYFVINRMFLEEDNGLKFEYETSRVNFIGRNNTTNNPRVIKRRENLSQTVGYALDPIMSFRREIVVEAGSKQSVYWIVGFGKSREQVMKIVNTYNTPLAIESAFEMATVLNNMRTSYAQMKAPQMCLYNNMLKHIFQTSSIDQRRREVLEKNTLSQKGLWRFGISGDFPIIVVEIDSMENALFAKDILQAYEFYKSRRLNVDIVFINDDQSEKKQMLNQYITDLKNKIYYFNYFEDSAGNVYTLSGEDISPTERTLLLTIARISLSTAEGKTLERQIKEMEPKLSVYFDKIHDTPPIETKSAVIPKDLMFYNEMGGFVNKGREYMILQNDTPTPWINVIANKNFGCLVSNTMSGFTYAYNSQRFKLTTWSNDMISDPPSEILLINDRKFVPSAARHGLGYSIFTAETNDFQITVTVFVAKEEPIKYYYIDIKNLSRDTLAIDMEMITKIVLGDSEEKTCRHLLSNFLEEENRLYFRNVYSTYFSNYHAFLSSTEKILKINTDKPTAKSIKIGFDIPSQSAKKTAFMIGCQKTDEHIPIHTLADIEREYEKVCNYWDKKLSVIQVSTPDESFNYSINTWYLYQTYAARLYARAGFYQVGGAFGFRDQLQDSMSILYSDPQQARNQILKHAAHQFPEGDVLHWWHEELLQGSRTTFSDDYLWLVYVSAEYISKTGDYSILDEIVPYVQAENLKENESERGVSYVVSAEKDTLYNHLKRCIHKALRQMGTHNLPLMGCGDWNDGMNRVGHEGKGESVWVAFFLLDNLQRMATLANNKQDAELAALCENAVPPLKQAVLENTWDGEWFLRAFFDNGDPLGSRNNTECQIDLLTQAWSILTDVATDKQKESLLRETEARLVDREYKLIKLLTPPFKSSKNNPGYIMDYLKGIRENGGQYTHAAAWYIMALIKEGLTDRACQYFTMINPINRSSSYADAMRYKVEPYSIAADIYTNSQHAGRGGWTWYSGSSNWAYKVGLEHILGFKKNGNQLLIDPKIPSSWNGFTLSYQYLDTLYSITVQRKNNGEQYKVYLDGSLVENGVITLENDGKKHEVRVEK
jgi:cellobiose phosphorylase